MGQILSAYAEGTGGGLCSPGDGTHRGATEGMMASVETEWRQAGRVPSGGIRRRFAGGGAAWSAAAMEARRTLSFAAQYPGPAEVLAVLSRLSERVAAGDPDAAAVVGVLEDAADVHRRAWLKETARRLAAQSGPVA